MPVRGQPSLTHTTNISVTVFSSRDRRGVLWRLPAVTPTPLSGFRLYVATPRRCGSDPTCCRDKAQRWHRNKLRRLSARFNNWRSLNQTQLLRYAVLLMAARQQQQRSEVAPATTTAVAPPRPRPPPPVEKIKKVDRKCSGNHSKKLGRRETFPDIVHRMPKHELRLLMTKTQVAAAKVKRELAVLFLLRRRIFALPTSGGLSPRGRSPFAAFQRGLSSLRILYM